MRFTKEEERAIKDGVRLLNGNANMWAAILEKYKKAPPPEPDVGRPEGQVAQHEQVRAATAIMLGGE